VGRVGASAVGIEETRASRVRIPANRITDFAWTSHAIVRFSRLSRRMPRRGRRAYPHQFEPALACGFVRR
jgi:hypothetical protein